MSSFHKERMIELRTLRAKLHSQNMILLKAKGKVYLENPIRCVDMEEYKREVLNHCVWKMNRKDVNAHKTNATRACEIIRDGEGARFWSARFSTSHTGSDRRGIVHHIRKFKPSILGE